MFLEIKLTARLMLHQPNIHCVTNGHIIFCVHRIKTDLTENLLGEVKKMMSSIFFVSFELYNYSSSHFIVSTERGIIIIHFLLRNTWLEQDDARDATAVPR